MIKNISKIITIIVAIVMGCSIYASSATTDPVTKLGGINPYLAGRVGIVQAKDYNEGVVLTGGVGVANAVIDKLNAELDASYVRFFNKDNIKTDLVPILAKLQYGVGFKSLNAYIAAGYGYTWLTNNNVGNDWKQTWDAGIGVNLSIAPEVVVSVGYDRLKARDINAMNVATFAVVRTF